MQPAAPPPPQSDLPPFSFNEAWSIGTELFKGNYGVLLGVAAVMCAVNALTEGVAEFVLKDQPEGWQFLWMIGTTCLLSIPLNAGIILVGGRAARRGRASFEDFFLGYPRLLALIGWSLLIALGAFVLLLPAGAVILAGGNSAGPLASSLLVIVLSLVYVPVFLFLFSRLQFAAPMLVDPDLPRRSVVDTAKLSWEATRGIWLPLLLVCITASLMVVASILLLCVGVLFVGVPLWIAVMGAAYAMVTSPLTPGTLRCRMCGLAIAGNAGGACPGCGTPQTT